MYNERFNSDLFCGAIVNFCWEILGSKRWDRVFGVLWRGILRFKIFVIFEYLRYLDLL